MNLQQLEYIIAVDQTKSFSKAAERCFVTQSTLSTMIKRLEEELDIIIFDRKNNPILTTDCGADIIEEAKKVIGHYRDLVDIAKSVKNKVAGKATIGIIPTIAGSLLPIIIKPIMEKYPELELDVREIHNDQLIDQLKSGKIDMGIASTPMRIKEVEESILYYEALMVYGDNEESKKYFLSSDLKNHDIWLFEDGHCLRNQAISLCELQEKKNRPRNLDFHANSFETLLNMVDAFGGLTLIPELYFNTLSEVKKCRVSQFSPPIPVREISLIYHRPFAKLRIIEMLSTEIKAKMRGQLLSEKYKNNELSLLKVY